MKFVCGLNHFYERRATFAKLCHCWNYETKRPILFVTLNNTMRRIIEKYTASNILKLKSHVENLFLPQSFP